MGRCSVGGIDCYGSGQASLAAACMRSQDAAKCTLLVRAGHDGRVVGDAGEVGKATSPEWGSYDSPM